MASIILVIAKPYDAEVVRNAVADAGYAAFVSDGSDDPCKQVEKLRPAAVVLSLRLARSDARQILTELRWGDYGGHVPVLLISEPGSSILNPKQAKEIGADYLVIRPLDPELLVTRIERLAGPSVVEPAKEAAEEEAAEDAEEAAAEAAKAAAEEAEEAAAEEAAEEEAAEAAEEAAVGEAAAEAAEAAEEEAAEAAEEAAVGEAAEEAAEAAAAEAAAEVAEAVAEEAAAEAAEEAAAEAVESIEIVAEEPVPVAWEEPAQVVAAEDAEVVAAEDVEVVAADDVEVVEEESIEIVAEEPAEILGVRAAKTVAEDEAEAVSTEPGVPPLINPRRLDTKYAQVCEADYFTLLELDPDAGGDEVEQAYQRIRQEFMPDRLPAELALDYSEKLAEIILVLDEAHQVLGNDAIRKAYRRHFNER